MGRVPPFASSLPPLGRRAFLVGLGAGAGLLAARGVGAGALLRGRDAPVGYEAVLRALGASLTPRQRALIVLPADDPSRQIVNTLTVLERPHLATLLSPEQRSLVGALYETMLSPRGRESFAGTVAVEGRLDGCVLAIYGEPTTGRAHSLIMGGHLMLRGGGESAQGAAFGGGIAYGHQIGNQRWRVLGNSFAHHGDAANALYAQLDAEARADAVLPAPPHELVLQPRGAGASFPGVAIGTLGEPAQAAAAALLDTVLASYPEPDRARAFDCIAANGGLAALHVAYFASHGFYADIARFGDLDAAQRAQRGDPYWQVWRLEGPGTVIHFQGWPHVHAYVQIVRDPARANVGEALGATPAGVEGEAMRALLEGALRRATGEALAFHPPEIAGRFCPGEITTGLAYSLDPYRNRVVVATIEGRAMATPLRERLAASGTSVAPAQRYRVATTDYSARQTTSFGMPTQVEVADTLLRDALVAHLRADQRALATG